MRLRAATCRPHAQENPGEVLGMNVVPAAQVKDVVLGAGVVMLLAWVGAGILGIVLAARFPLWPLT
jgi:hypothetical protein